MHSTSAINAYNKVGTESAVIGADPHTLISMLFQGALLAIASAKREILHNEISAKGKSISRAIAIIGEGLHASLDKSAGGELAHNLASLYDYMVRKLVAANLNNDVAALDEVTRLLNELAGAWDAIRPTIMQTDPQPNGSANVQRVRATA
jgi:flagellar secretion chaperone FliS